MELGIRKVIIMIRATLYGLVLFLTMAAEAFAQEKETIRWLGWEQSPNFITAGKLKGQGIGDSLTKALQLLLPQYDHELVISNTRRYNILIREENVCVAWAWIVPGSRSYRIHSRPVSLAPPSGIHTLKSKRHLFGQPGEVLSLAHLLETPTLKLGYLEEMTYSKSVHELLAQYRGKNNVHFSSRSTVEFSLVMLDTNRLDYFFGFPSQAIFDAKIKGIPNKYQFYNIEEIDMYTSMYTHCSNTPFGEAVMAQVSKILTNDILMEHLAVVEKWNGKSNRYRDVFIDYVVNQQQSEFVNHPGE